MAGDPAFKPVVKIPVPQEVSVKRSAKECASQLDEYLLICNIPGPMSAGTDYRVVQNIILVQVQSCPNLLHESCCKHSDAFPNKGALMEC